MKFLALQPFVPSGPDFERSKQLFLELGFTLNWDAGGYAGMERDGCHFILQHFEDRHFAENFMISVNVDDVDAFYKEMSGKGLAEKYGIRLSAPAEQPYGRESNLIDIAGVCWHFVQ